MQEGLALLTEYLITGHFNRALLAGFQSPEISLTEGFAFHNREMQSKRQTLAQYGHALQYFYYLYRLCGKDALYTTLVSGTSAETGVGFINETLKTLGSTQQLDPVCASFETSFRAFQKARFFPGVSSASAYVISPELAATPSPNSSAADLPMPAYSARISKSGKLEIRLE